MDTFEIGDKVRVIGLTDVYAGRSGVIVDHLENGVNYRVKLDLGNNDMHRIYHASWLELWKPAEPDTYTRLQQENADLIIERDTMDADRKRLREELDRLRKSNETLRRHLHDLAMLEGTEDVGEHRERITILREYE